MNKELELTIIELSRYIRDSARNGCSSEVLRTLPELTKATADLVEAHKAM